ncbi:response regulator [bacterium]|nr:response regulator [bacterium]
MGNKVLLVEDEKGTRDVVFDFLDASGFEVFVAKNGEEGFEAFVEHVPDVVLTDVLLPRVTGFEMIDRIRNHPLGKKVPVVVMSALYKTPKIKHEAREKYGVSDYFIKPVSLQQAAARLAEIVGLTPEQLAIAKAAESDGAGGILDVFGDRRVDIIRTFDLPPPADGPSPEPPADPGDAGALKSAGDAVYALLGWYREGVTGIASFEHGNVSKKVYLLRGDAIYVTSTRVEETFGHMLVAEGLIAGDQLNAALLKSRQENRLLGRILVEEDLVDNTVLTRFLVREVDARLRDLFRWDGGRYELARTDAFVEKIKRPALHLPNYYYMAALGGAFDDRLIARYGTAAHAFVAKDPDRLFVMGHVEWEPDDLLITAHIDGERTVGRIVEETQRSPRRVYRVLGTLELAGAVRLAAPVR